MSNLHNGHRSRIKKEFLQNGMEHFEEHKILELLLFYSVPRLDTNPLGHLLIERFGSIAGVLDAPFELLCEVEGIGPESATLIKIVSGVVKAYLDDYTSKNNIISDVNSAKEYMRYKFIGEQSECLYMACLAHNNKVILCKKVAQGGPETVTIMPGEIVKTALRANAVKVILAHNHPNGFAIPSTKDILATTMLHDALARVDIELVDHIIVAPDDIASMAEQGNLPRNVRLR